MPRYTYIQNNFTSGQISERLNLRTDIREFKAGLKEMTNFLPTRSGGASRRGGFVKYGDAGLLGTYQGSTYSFEYETSAFENFLCEIFKVDNVGIGNIQMTMTKTGDGLALEAPILVDFSANARTYTNLVIDDPKGFNKVQIEDVVVITHRSGDLQPLVIARISDTEFTCKTWTESFSTDSGIPLLNISSSLKIPVKDPNVTDKSIFCHNRVLPTPPSADIQISMREGGVDIPFWTADDIGKTYTVDGGGSSKFFIFVVKNIVNSTRITATIVFSNFDSGTAGYTTDYWYEPAWSDKDGWPRTVALYQSRLVFGGNKRQPATIWASQQYDYFMMNRYFDYQRAGIVYYREPSATQLAFELSIASQKPQAITWMIVGRSLAIGTTNDEYIVSTNGQAFSRLNVGFQKQTSHGSLPIQPAQADNFTYFVSRDGKSVIEFGYSEENGSFISRNLMILSDDIIYTDPKSKRDRIVQLHWNESLSTLFILTDLGKLCSITLNRSGGITSFSQHTVEGDIQFLANANTASSDFERLVVYTTNVGFLTSGNNLERLGIDEIQANEREAGDIVFGSIGLPFPIEPDYYLDYSSGSASASAVTNHTYEADDGTLVDVLTKEGTVYRNLVVTSNTVSLPAPTQECLIGRPYKSRLETTRLEAGSNELLNSQGDVIRIDRATIGMYNSQGGEYGAGDTLYEFEYEDSVATKTGKVRVDIPQSPDVENTVIIETDSPLPMNVTGIVFRGKNNP